MTIRLLTFALLPILMLSHVPRPAFWLYIVWCGILFVIPVNYRIGGEETRTQAAIGPKILKGPGLGSKPV